MPGPHETIYVRVTDDGYGGTKYLYSGSGIADWSDGFSRHIDYHHDCTGSLAGKVYKFDQSHTSNIGHRIGFTHSYYVGPLPEASGVFYYGTPGQAGASTKVHVGIMFSGQATGYANGAPLIHAFADTSTSHDYGDNYFDLAEGEYHFQFAMGGDYIPWEKTIFITTPGFFQTTCCLSSIRHFRPCEAVLVRLCSVPVHHNGSQAVAENVERRFWPIVNPIDGDDEAKYGVGGGVYTYRAQDRDQHDKPGGGNGSSAHGCHG